MFLFIPRLFIKKLFITLLLFQTPKNHETQELACLFAQKTLILLQAATATLN